MRAITRMRNATKLDKARWLIVCSSDTLMVVALVGFVQLYFGWQQGLPWQLAATAALLLLTLVVLSTRPFRIAVRGGKRPTAIIAVAGVIVLLLSFVPVFWATATWLGMVATFARRRTVVALSVASIVVTNLYVTLANAFLPELLLVQVLITVISVGAVWAHLRLWHLTKEAHEGQEALSRLAVSEERLRFARDLNDLLGQSLTDIAARTAHAERTLRSGQEAAPEMFEVRDLARRSLREVRNVVQSYRAIDLDEVLASVRAVLEAADVRCTVRAEISSLSPETRTLLATVVREGATNVLKHSKAERCTIIIQDGVLEMSNDGVNGPVGAHAPNGLAGLAQRVRAAGGTLEARPTREGHYLLRAAVPA
ncbi:sensor histidine kinase [Nonomuraea longispora]|uniref:Sensor histidine kinase n=1 Tax=Nonomuraea longispora TaxID=1848320 RepID=A0A4R4NTI0_9ACTN|nr:histidine kinase [Nonomuraea longispora]TDC11333.1 sensor histidine kinase [Nonomuraea longispora]